MSTENELSRALVKFPIRLFAKVLELQTLPGIEVTMKEQIVGWGLAIIDRNLGFYVANTIPHTATEQEVLFVVADLAKEFISEQRKRSTVT